MSTTGATLSAPAVDGSSHSSMSEYDVDLQNDTVEKPIHKSRRVVYLEVDPSAIGFCIGRGKCNLKTIGQQLREETGESVFIKYNNRVKSHPNGRFEILSPSETTCQRAKKMLYDLEQDYLIIQQDKPKNPVDQKNKHPSERIQVRDPHHTKGNGRGRGRGRGRGQSIQSKRDTPTHFIWREE